MAELVLMTTARAKDEGETRKKFVTAHVLLIRQHLKVDSIEDVLPNRELHVIAFVAVEEGVLCRGKVDAE
eukprot:CAMPEP_0177788114 /NCGR_PEP_ID=MMETSP0491_2-20121128/21911_1 /TAXON_ID=63592 /ORGANISM="Tetraselmis chuii, Strain PLY429" /LENGTH=69 /DNA_ID=CAMNT_0019309625 /DNA_START=454 /DNA_END=663 /DNA_ORIENTATION=+